MKPLYVLLTALVMLVFGGLFVTTCHAHMFTQNDCISLANDAVTFAERHRLSPETTEHDQMVLDMVLSMRMGSEGSYVQDAKDKTTVLNVFQEVINSDWTPGQAYDNEYDKCMKKAEPELPKGEKRSGPQVES